MAVSPPPGLNTADLVVWYQAHPEVTPPATGYGSLPGGAAGAGLPSGTPLTVAQQTELGNTQALAGTGSAKTADTPITLTGLPPQLQLLLSTAGISPNGSPDPTTGATVGWTSASFAKALAGVHNPALVSSIQQMLFYAGAYPSSVTSLSQLPLGSFTAPDATALTKTVTDAGSLGQTFGTYLNQSANVGKAQGVLTTITGAGKTPVALPNGIDEDAVLKSQAQSILGHDPDASDLAAFRAFYNQAVLQGSKQAQQAAAQQQAQGLPDTDTLATAIGDAQNPLAKPATPLPPPMLAKPGTELPGTSANSAQQQAAAGYYNQTTTDANALGAVNAAGAQADNGQPSTYTSAPDMSAAADSFLQSRYGGEIAQTSALGKYAQIYNAMAGK